MAVQRCPRCGDLYLVRAERCDSCGVALEEVEDRQPDEPAMATASGEHERWELHTWTMEGRRLLDGMLSNSGIPRSWQGSTLLTPEVEHDRVEEMVESVAERDSWVGADETDEGAPAAAVVSKDLEARGTDEDGPAEVAYDLGGWTDAARGELVAALAGADVPHRWDDDSDLVVATADEARVDAIFDELSGDDDGGAGAWDDPDGIDDGLLVQETLSDLFVGADRLLHNPLDGSSSRQVIEARDTARSLRLPFGFERIQWQGILGAADALVECVSPPAGAEGEPRQPDDEEIRAAASALRTRLRDVV